MARLPMRLLGLFPADDVVVRGELPGVRRHVDASRRAGRGSRGSERPMNDLIRRGRAWAPVLKSAVIFVLPMPLVLAAMFALGSETRALAPTGGALACSVVRGCVVWRALVAEARYFLGERPDPPKLPLKLFGAMLTAMGAGLAATAGGHGLVSAACSGCWPGSLCALLRPGSAAEARRRPVVEASIPPLSRRGETCLRTTAGHRGCRARIAVPEFGDRLNGSSTSAAASCRRSNATRATLRAQGDSSTSISTAPNVSPPNTHVRIGRCASAAGREFPPTADRHGKDVRAAAPEADRKRYDVARRRNRSAERPTETRRRQLTAR